MKIFISHASANKEYGNALVNLLRGIGIKEEEIIFTSNTAYGIPIGQNIFNWLKSQISEKPFVIYLLSREYYSSVACLNEMGAAWVIENEHAMLFTPNFDISSKEFQNGAIDPREIGFYINNEERLLSFIQHLEKYFSISKNTIIVNQTLKKYLEEISLIDSQPSLIVTKNEIWKDSKNKTLESHSKQEHQKDIVAHIPVSKISNTASNPIKNGPYSKFVEDILSGKLKNEELILLHYVIETGRVRLLTGWQEDIEIKNIKAWEEIGNLNNFLSNKYPDVIRKFELRGYTEVSAFTGSNNPKEVKLKFEIETNIIDLPQEVLEVINKAIEKCKIQEIKEGYDGLPF